MRSWRSSSLMAVLAAATAFGGGCMGARESRRLSARQHVQMGQGMSKEAAELSRKETIASMTAQEQARREGEIRMPHHVGEPAKAPVAEPSTQPVAERANDATAHGRTAQMERVQIGAATVGWPSMDDLTCALP